jgi:hypothetical protein
MDVGKIARQGYEHVAGALDALDAPGRYQTLRNVGSYAILVASSQAFAFTSLAYHAFQASKVLCNYVVMRLTGENTVTFASIWASLKAQQGKHIAPACMIIVGAWIPAGSTKSSLVLDHRVQQLFDARSEKSVWRKISDNFGKYIPSARTVIRTWAYLQVAFMYVWFIRTLMGLNRGNGFSGGGGHNSNGSRPPPSRPPVSSSLERFNNFEILKKCEPLEGHQSLVSNCFRGNFGAVGADNGMASAIFGSSDCKIVKKVWRKLMLEVSKVKAVGYCKSIHDIAVCLNAAKDILCK